MRDGRWMTGLPFPPPLCEELSRNSTSCLALCPSGIEQEWVGYARSDAPGEGSECMYHSTTVGTAYSLRGELRGTPID